MKTICPYCKGETDADSLSIGRQMQCPKCGRAFTVANPNLYPCPECGAMVSKSAKACPSCGAPLASQAPRPAEEPGKVLLVAHPAMFRSHPVEYFACLLLVVVFGLGLLVLLVWRLAVRCTTLTVTSERVTCTRGFFSKAETDIFIRDIRDIQIRQSFSQRVFGVGKVSIATAGTSGFEISMDGIANPSKVKALLDGLRARYV
jgi:membrane protein YdbS with pleckstrin-like domain/DNA-directed RNA polymerase subunit RPC12/RpoP